jgi:hypothetical protein
MTGDESMSRAALISRDSPEKPDLGDTADLFYCHERIYALTGTPRSAVFADEVFAERNLVKTNNLNFSASLCKRSAMLSVKMLFFCMIFLRFVWEFWSFGLIRSDYLEIRA